MCIAEDAHELCLYLPVYSMRVLYIYALNVPCQGAHKVRVYSLAVFYTCIHLQYSIRVFTCIILYVYSLAVLYTCIHLQYSIRVFTCIFPVPTACLLRVHCRRCSRTAPLFVFANTCAYSKCARGAHGFFLDPHCNWLFYVCIAEGANELRLPARLPRTHTLCLYGFVYSVCVLQKVLRSCGFIVGVYYTCASQQVPTNAPSCSAHTSCPNRLILIVGLTK